MATSLEAHARRAEWRAALLEYGAAGQRSFGDVKGAAEKEAWAALLREDARLTRDVQAAKDTMGASRPEREAQAQHRKLMREVMEAAGYAAMGDRSVTHDWSEPSDEELMAS